MTLSITKLYEIKGLNHAVQKIDHDNNRYDAIIYSSNGDVPFMKAYANEFQPINNQLHYKEAQASLTIEGTPAAHTQSINYWYNDTLLGTYDDEGTAEPQKGKTHIKWATAIGRFPLINYNNSTIINKMNEFSRINGFDKLVTKYSQNHEQLKRMEFCCASDGTTFGIQLADYHDNSYYMFFNMYDIHNLFNKASNGKSSSITELNYPQINFISGSKWRKLTHAPSVKDTSIQGMCISSQRTFYICSQHAPKGAFVYPATIVRYKSDDTSLKPVSDNFNPPIEYNGNDQLYPELENIQYMYGNVVNVNVAWHDLSGATKKNIVYQVEFND